MSLWAGGLVAGPDRGSHPINPRPVPTRLHDAGHDLELDQPGDDRATGILLFQIGDVGFHPFRGNAITGGDVVIEQPFGGGPGEPPAVAFRHSPDSRAESDLPGRHPLPVGLPRAALPATVADRVGAILRPVCSAARRRSRILRSLSWS